MSSRPPVGGIALLGEAVLDAHDDPDAVERFALRIVSEAERLTRLVQEIIGLSRLEMQHTLAEPKPVDLGEATHGPWSARSCPPRPSRSPWSAAPNQGASSSATASCSSLPSAT